ncbi:hypothetical protein P280DRAFT_256250 [Massarina eburnea CBS 473.64]|uniref:Uncharacterized protein n=1 Tax=Massarina eburnea CBS 473.64 TaxID=1395130 RepID=A0A6A6S7F4_9PLEO|nr:hypothetical protein P280DRAFT_256250 [Massarina eburnea CBS 473.64]
MFLSACTHPPATHTDRMITTTPSSSPTINLSSLAQVPEIISMILNHMIGKYTHPHVHTPTTFANFAPHCSGDPLIQLHASERYITGVTCETSFDPTILPPPLQYEFARLLRHRWIRGPKTFLRPEMFALIHLIRLKHSSHFNNLRTNGFRKIRRKIRRRYDLPAPMISHPRVPLHGLERLHLSLGSRTNMSVFQVHVP